MEYKTSDYQEHTASVSQAFVTACDAYANMFCAQDDTLARKGRMLVDVLGDHGVIAKDLDKFAPLEPSDVGVVVDRGYNGKKPLYYFPRAQTFARGTHFGRQSSFRVVTDYADMVGVAELLLQAGDFNRIVAGLEPVGLNTLLAAWKKMK